MTAGVKYKLVERRRRGSRNTVRTRYISIRVSLGFGNSSKDTIHFQLHITRLKFSFIHIQYYQEFFTKIVIGE